MKRKNIGKTLIALLLVITMLLPVSSLQALAAVGDLSNVSTGLTGEIDTNDTISLPIKIYDYEADGMLFEYAESKEVKNASDFGATCEVDFTSLTAISSVTTSIYGDFWSNTTTTLDTSNSNASFLRATWAKNSTQAPHTVYGRTGVILPNDINLSMDNARYLVLVYRSNVTSGKIGFFVERANADRSNTDNRVGDLTFTSEGTTNWTYAVYDLKQGNLANTWNEHGNATAIWTTLPMDASGEYIDIAHVALFSDESQAEKFGEYALTDGSDRGDNRGFGLLRSSRNQSGGDNYAGIIDKTNTVEQLNTYGDTTSIDFSSLTTLNYTLLGTFREAGIANVGLLEPSLSAEGYPVYKEEVVTYLAGLLEHSLGIPERTSDGWKNYRYVKGTASSVYGGTDLATALRNKIKGNTGSYAAASGKDLVGTWSEVGGNIASYYDAAYFLLNSIFVSGSYNEVQDDYDYLVLSAGTDSETGGKTYVFDGGFTTSATPASASSAVKYDEENNTIQNSSAVGKTHFVYEGSSTTTLNPFLPVTDRNNANGQTINPYYQDDGVLNTGDTKDTLVNRNYNFAMVSEGEFTYYADDELFFDFEGDDDVYLFINGELVMDIGSAHSIDGVRFNVNDYVNAAKAGTLGSDARNKALALEEGNTYSFKFYYMERHSYGSNIRINTNIKVTDPSMTTAKTAYQDGTQLDYGSIVNKDGIVEYGFALTNNGEENLYNLTFKDNDIGVTLDPKAGLTITGDRVYDVNGEKLDASDLIATISGPDYDDITVTFADNAALKDFLASLTSDAVKENGGGLWIGSTVLIRGIGYKLSTDQIKAGVFDNTVFTTATNNTKTKTLQGQASMRVFVPADPMYYEWADHDLSVTKTKLIEDVLAAAKQSDNILNNKVSNLTTSNVNKIELVTKAGTAISSDNVTIDSSYGLTINYENTGSHVFYVKITYNSSENTVIVPVLVNVTDVKDSVYVLDYGLSVNLTENDELFKNDTLTVPGRDTDYDLLAIGNGTASYSKNSITFKKSDGNTVDGENGNFVLAGKTLTYKPDDFMEEIDIVKIAISVHESDYTSPTLGTTEINDEAQMYKSVSVLPATVVYYEDDFPAITYEGTNIFTNLGDSDGSANLTQSADQKQEYGQDKTYQNASNTAVSGESLTKITISDSKQVASFNFKGTGFELIGRTNATDSASLIVRVYEVAEDGTVGTTAVKTIPVITEFDNGADGGSEEIYQVPVIRVKDLDLGKYKVTISGVPSRTYNADGTSTIVPTYLYVDGLRIFQPMGETNENYTVTENGATFAEIRNLIMDGNVAVANYDGEKVTVSTSTITWTENRNGETYDGTVYKGNVVNSINDYLTLGPNNEVYMDGTYTTEALVFYVKETGDGKHNLQIAVHGVDEGLFLGTSSTGISAVIQYGVKKSDGTYTWEPLVTTKSATEQYYTIDYTKCPYIEGKGYQVAVKVNSGMASYTSLKYNGLTIDENVGTVKTLKYVNGILTDSSQATATALDEGDYPVFYSIRSQLMTASLDDEEVEETTESETEETTEATTEETTETSEAEGSTETETEESTETPAVEESSETETDDSDETPSVEESSEVETEESTETSEVEESSEETTEETTKAPETTVPETEETTKAPETTVPETEETTKAPETTAPETEETTKAPETTVPETEETTKAPETTESETEETTEAPETETPEVEESTETEAEETTEAPEVEESGETETEESGNQSGSGIIESITNVINWFSNLIKGWFGK